MTFPSASTLAFDHYLQWGAKLVLVLLKLSTRKEDEKLHMWEVGGLAHLIYLFRQFKAHNTVKLHRQIEKFIHL